MTFFFFFNDTATTEIYTLSLHDALPISFESPAGGHQGGHRFCRHGRRAAGLGLPATQRAPDLSRDRKSTRLNSSHANISYAVFCLKKKKNQIKQQPHYTHTLEYTRYRIR